MRGQAGFFDIDERLKDLSAKRFDAAVKASGYLAMGGQIHHHATLCIAAYGFLVAERGAFSPSAERRPAPIEVDPLPQAYRPRGAPDPA